MAQGKLRRERCLLDIGRPPRVYSQALGNCGSAQVKTFNGGTRGTNMATKEVAVLQGVATLCSERPKESKKEDLGKEPAEAQPQESATTRKRYSGAARRRYKKQQQREVGERAVQAVTQQTDAAAISPGSREQGPTRAVRRSRLDSSMQMISILFKNNINNVKHNVLNGSKLYITHSLLKHIFMS